MSYSGLKVTTFIISKMTSFEETKWLQNHWLLNRVARFLRFPSKIFIPNMLSSKSSVVKKTGWVSKLALKDVHSKQIFFKRNWWLNGIFDRPQRSLFKTMLSSKSVVVKWDGCVSKLALKDVRSKQVVFKSNWLLSRIYTPPRRSSFNTSCLQGHWM